MKNFAMTGVAGYIAPRHLKAIQIIGRARLFFENTESLPARHVGQGEVEKHCRRRPPLRVRESFASTRRFDDVITMKTQACG